MRYKNTVTKDSVLVVDDDREIRTLLCDYLEQNGYRANAVPYGKAMWAALEASTQQVTAMPTCKGSWASTMRGLHRRNRGASFARQGHR
jgi:CheY-like chemotaxis protein